jgi:2-polyprenyl-3-methyl-5-hydroxy-6-metoxy-1,4-benzoquinol methylase
MNFKEKDIRPEELMKKKEPALQHDKQFLKSRMSQFVKVSCVACGNLKNNFWAEKDGFRYEICPSCETIFMNPRADEKLLSEFYKQSKNYEFWNKHIFPLTDSVRKEKIFKPRALKTVEFCKKYNIKGDLLIEIGSAFGTYCEALKELNYFKKILAVEPTPSLAETCRKKGLEVIESTVEDLQINHEVADVVANFEVIEHLFNPLRFVEQCVKYLKKGGLFICTCPSGMGLGTLVLKEKARVVDHEHLNYFNPHSLSLLIEKCELELLEVSTPGELDVDLLENHLKEEPSILNHNLFVKKIVTSYETTKRNFQKFLKENLLSSHLWIVGRKK